MTVRFGILTVSDRSWRGERPDKSGPALEETVSGQGWEIAIRGIVPDDLDLIKQTLVEWAGDERVDVILTTGGTGFAPRDVTPEATQAVIDREAPGIAEAMRSASLKITPHAMLSRAAAGMCGRTLIINLPGSPRAAIENIQVILPVLAHAVELLHEDPGAECGHRIPPETN